MKINQFNLFGSILFLTAALKKGSGQLVNITINSNINNDIVQSNQLIYPAIIPENIAILEHYTPNNSTIDSKIEYINSLEDPDMYLSEAIYSFSKGNYKDTIDNTSKAIKLRKEKGLFPDPEDYNWRGTAYYKLGLYKEAIDDATQLIKLYRDKGISPVHAYNLRRHANYMEGNYFYSETDIPLEVYYSDDPGLRILKAIIPLEVLMMVACHIYINRRERRQEIAEQNAWRASEAKKLEPIEVRNVILALQDDIEKLIANHYNKNDLKELFSMVLEKEKAPDFFIKQHLKKMLPAKDEKSIHNLTEDLCLIRYSADHLNTRYTSYTQEALRTIGKEELDKYIDLTNQGEAKAKKEIINKYNLAESSKNPFIRNISTNTSQTWANKTTSLSGKSFEIA